MAAEQVSETQAETPQFRQHDYVLYVGRNSGWNGFYVVWRMNEDGSVFLRQSNGAEISRCPASDLRLLYRPTPEEIEQAAPRRRVLR
jgi:hypothetical protein